ncbi:protein kinase C delta type-like [Xenopus laevis]|uniref:Protein kinase C delta type-like n=1 Tax=Xenopus laevis TaxID=8355 RepID=A0A8J0TBA2_XENLA|nr:protein kinase C delta type-like [Xenopus laevis]
MKRSNSYFGDLRPEEKKRRCGSKDVGKSKKKEWKRKRSLEEQQKPDECCREQKRKKEKCDEGAAGPVNEQAQPPRLNPLSISSYNFNSQLGAGGFAKVMLAQLGSRKPYVAVKSIIKTANTTDESLLTEANLLKIARDSPFLCQGYAAFQTQRHAFFVMEFLSGGSIEDELKDQGTLPIERVRFHSAEIICGLQFLHGKGIIHRDIKPMNILLDHQGHTKISDFGLAEENIFPGDTTTGWVGTLEYMAPEVRFAITVYLQQKSSKARSIEEWQGSRSVYKIQLMPFKDIEVPLLAKIIIK